MGPADTTRLPSVGASRVLWRVAQGAGLLATALLLVGLVAVPDAALRALWDIAIPLVPASLLVSPMLWRNTCPLATLNLLGNGWLGRRPLGGRALERAGAAGIALLVILVPARRFLFNTDGAALAVTVAAVGLLALALGTLFDAKAGFCNAFCPVLPVERLYGQAPLLKLGNTRCEPCTLCAVPGCIDLNPGKAPLQMLGGARGGAAWLATPFGAFAAAFPGFVVGYYTLENGRLATAGGVYLHVILWMAASYAVTAAAVGIARPATPRALALLAGAGVGLYYWFASPVLAAGLGLPQPYAVPLRVLFLGLATAWLYRAVRR
jgi:hypothetical protein